MRNSGLFFLITVVSLSLACTGPAVAPPTVQPNQAEQANSSQVRDVSNPAPGQAIFEQYCLPCHSLAADQNLVGPTLAGISSRSSATIADAAYQGQADSVESYLRESLLTPNAHTVDGFVGNIMPSYQETLTAEEIDLLVTYLLTLE